MSAQHWLVKQTPGRGWFSVWNGETCIADILTESEALTIAAAPELLSACRSALNVGEIAFESCALSRDVGAKLRAAIAKATGGAS